MAAITSHLRAGLRRSILALLGVGLLLPAALAQELPTPKRRAPRAHAHNDYEHTRPLLDALDRGFRSVEADIHLVDGALLVAHDRDKASPARTLQALYLEPLRQRFGPGSSPRGNNASDFILLIDLKSAAEPTYRALATVLTNYQSMLTAFRSNRTDRGAVTIILSGNRPRKLVESEPVRWVAIDGRIEDLTTSFSEHLIPLISDNWRLHFQWQGVGPFPASEKQRLNEIVRRAHGQKCLVRFWAAPDNPAGWAVLKDAGVDLLNTDDLAGMEKYLSPSAQK